MTHLKLAGAFGVLGFVFTSRPWLQWLNTLGPEMGFIVKTAVIFLVVLGLQSIDAVIQIDRRQTFGVLVIYTAFLLIFNYQSGWIKDSGSTNVELQTADGIAYHRSKNSLNLNPEMARLVSFVVLPTVLVLVGSIFIRRGQNVNLD